MSHCSLYYNETANQFRIYCHGYNYWYYLDMNGDGLVKGKLDTHTVHVMMINNLNYGQDELPHILMRCYEGYYHDHVKVWDHNLPEGSKTKERIYAS